MLPLMVRYPELVLGLKLKVTSTGVFIVPAVYTLVVYQLFNSAVPLHTKLTASGVSSQIANISAIYLLALYCEGICTRAFPASYLTGTFCLYILNPNA